MVCKLLICILYFFLLENEFVLKKLKYRELDRIYDDIHNRNTNITC